METVPVAPGVYQMIGAGDIVLYVGKAKDLPKRLASYTRPQRLEYRIQAMISQVARVETITTSTEPEALLLESNLIKKYSPRYNILLKDGKSFPYILMTGNHDFPRITKHRGSQSAKGSYYGPFPSAGAVNKAISDLQKAFLLRPCSDSYFAARTRPCMEYQIKRCSAPCVEKITKEEYAELVEQAQSFLKGKSRELQTRLAAQMEEASLQMQFEKAAVFRDRIKALNAIQARQHINPAHVEDADVVGIAREGGACCLQVTFFRGGQHYGSQSVFPRNTEDQLDTDILEAFLTQFYGEGNPPPKELFLPREINEVAFWEEYLALLSGHKVSITAPKLGEKKKLVEDAVRNAGQALKQKLATTTRQKDVLTQVQALFSLTGLPKRIEVYDNSHISGQYPIGAMIVAGEEGFIKKAYRRFNIRDKALTPGDDYAMMVEVLTRRFSRLKQECPDKQEGIWPDLVLIDGGAGHMATVSRVFEQLGLAGEVIFACISKGPDRNAGREQFHMPGRESFTLPYSDPVMYYLQTLRDEAHRFAIGSHRNKRAKSTTRSSLDEIPGIGPKRKKLLLNHFGSFDAVRQATLEELMAVGGVSRKLAEEIRKMV